MGTAEYDYPGQSSGTRACDAVGQAIANDVGDGHAHAVGSPTSEGTVTKYLQEIVSAFPARSGP